MIYIFCSLYTVAIFAPEVSSVLCVEGRQVSPQHLFAPSGGWGLGGRELVKKGEL